MRTSIALLAACLSVAAAPAHQGASTQPHTLTVRAAGFAEAVVEFSHSVVVSGDPLGSFDFDEGTYDIEAMSLTTDAAFAAVALVQETDDDLGLELIARQHAATGSPTEGITVNGRDSLGPDAYTLDAGRYRLFVLSPGPSTFTLQLDGLPSDIDLEAAPTLEAGALEVEQHSPALATRQWVTRRRFRDPVTAMVLTWHHSETSVPVRATSHCRLDDSSDTTVTWLPGCPSGRNPSGASGPDFQLASAGGHWINSYFYTHPSFDPIVGVSWSVSQDPTSAPVRAGMLGLWWSRLPAG